MKKIWVITLIILAIVAVIIYANKDNTNPIQQSPDREMSINKNTIYILDFNFAPDIITVKKDDNVLWVNQDQAIHQIKFNDSDLSSQMGIGESFSQTFNQSGDFDYSCAIHPSMKGKVIVK